MADKRAFRTLVASMERKAKELSEYVKQSEANDRVAQSKREKLQKDIATLDEVVGRCVGPSENNADEIHAKQLEVLNLVEIALEGAEDFLELEKSKKDVQAKILDVESVHKSVCFRLSHINDKIMKEKAEHGINLQSREVYSNELEDLEVMAKNAIENVNFLILNDVNNKSEHQKYQTKFDKISGDILESRLSLIDKSESELK